MKDAKGHGSNPRGGGVPVVRLDTAGSRMPKTGYMGSAKQETIAKMRAVDATHYPPSTITDRMAATALGQGHPKSNEVPLGSSFSAGQTALWKGRNFALPRGADGRRSR